MCGISGLVSRKNDAPKRSQILAMIASQRHRGPDGEGHFEGPGFLFGHNRLAILDLSEAGLQPMKLRQKDGAGELVIVFNGEIYNYKEIRDELRALGHRFETQTDTEVLLHAFQEWDVAALDRFNGMFAFVIYDSLKNRLFGARDRFGVKPLHLRMTADTFAFASEIKALLAIESPSTPDRQTVVDFLYSGHIQHTGRTFFEGIEELKPGHYFNYELGENRIEVKTWYDLRTHLNRRGSDNFGSAADAANQIRELLEDSVRLRLRSDVRVGTCLSGGVDSSSIATLAARDYKGGSFFGITAESRDPESDESEFAKVVALNSKLDWHRVKPDDFRTDIDRVLQAQDEPFSGLSVFMQDAVMREARRLKVPVLLDGQGGDEVFLGYPKYLQAKTFTSAKLTAKKLASALGFVETREFDRDLKQTAAREFAVCREHLVRYRRGLSDQREAQINDITQTNLPQLLRYEDRNSMHSSIETRLPFLDYRLVELGVALPFDMKIRGGIQKAVLRDAMRGVTPDLILDRKDKVGFAAPDRSWEPHFRALYRDNVLKSQFLRDLLPKTVEDARSADNPSRAWKLIIIAIWSKTYFR